MQCFSAFKGVDDFGKPHDFRGDWNKVALHFYGYDGMNILGFGGR